MLAALGPWVLVARLGVVVLCVFQGASVLAERLTWAVALALGALLVYATGSVAVVV